MPQYILLLILCLICNAIFVAGKFAFVQLRREYIEELVRDGKEKAKFLLTLYDRPTVFLGMAQLGMAISSLAAGVVITLLFFHIYPLLVSIITSWWLVWLVYLCLFLVLAIILQWVLCELVPKSLGLERAESSLMTVGRFIYFWSRLLFPVIQFGNWFGRKIMGVLGLSVTNEIDMAHSEDEIRMLVTASHREGKIDQVESELIGNVFDFADRLAKEIMVPRQEIVCLYVGDSTAIDMQTIRKSRHTRYPLCSEDKDHILGLVHIKDFMDLYLNHRSNLRLITRPILMIPEVMHASKLLQLMRAQRTYLAIVVDEYGSTVGLIGLEDIMEELVGNIQNEHHAEKEDIQPLADGEYEFDGTVLLEDVEELLHIPVEEDVDTDTIGGYIFNLLGHTASVREEVEIGNYRFIVLEIQGFRISRVKAVPKAELKNENGESDET